MRQLLVRWSKQHRRGRRGNGAGGFRLGPSAPSGPHVHSPRHPLQDRYTLFDALRLRTNNHWRNVWHVHGTTGSPCSLCSREQSNGETTSSPKPGKPFAATQASLLTSIKQQPSSWRVSADLRRLLQRRRIELRVHLDVVATSSVHNHANEWQIANEGVAVARECAESS